MKVGSASMISLVCQQCDKENTIVTSGQHQYGKRGPKPYDINTRIALGAIDNGIGYTYVNSFLSTLNIPAQQSTKLLTKTESEKLARQWKKWLLIHVKWF